MLYNALMFFFIYGFFGWCLEVCYHAIKLGKWENRGFLNGAICPIYGVGMVAIYEILEPISGFWPLIFVGGVILCSAIELITGFALNKIFHQRWWDYSAEPLNFKGYICLKFSVYWGAGVLVMVKLVHPSIEQFVQWIPFNVGMVALIVAVLILLIDSVDTFRTVIGINRELESIHEAAAMIRKMSDGLSERIYDGSMRAMEEKAEVGQKLQESKEELGQKLQESKEELEQKMQAGSEELGLQFALGKAEMESRTEELRELAEEMARNLKRGQRRMLRAFPNMKSTLYEADMDTIIENVKERIKKHTLSK